MGLIGIPIAPLLVGKVEYQHLGAAAALDDDRAGVGLQRVPGGQRPAVDGRLAARDEHLALAARGQPLLGALRPVDKAAVAPGGLLSRARAVAPIARGDEPPPAALLVGSEVL